MVSEGRPAGPATISVCEGARPEAGVVQQQYRRERRVDAYRSRWCELYKLCQVHLFSAKALNDLCWVREVRSSSLCTSS
ncbi:hypothetical protein Cni_G12310 [Canna indica]|uniref:Uncharacterized protein n=1 Tax=Canna indica TaxID=4628 RepID=A0AAQ3K9I7_9LILI|nr:hypothetical protein Cni_G12310 [Canna indica]